MGKITIFTEKDYDYFCMFSHLSNIDDEYEHPELIDNGLIELRKKYDGSKAYVYQYFPNKFTVGHFVTEIINKNYIFMTPLESKKYFENILSSDIKL